MASRFYKVHTYGKPLTDMQRKILDLYAQGLNGTEIASRLDISTRTLESHLQGARLRMGARRLPDQVALYITVRKGGFYRAWTPIEDEHLSEHKDEDPVLIATALNRSVESVRKRLNDLAEK